MPTARGVDSHGLVTARKHQNKLIETDKGRLTAGDSAGLPVRIE